MKNENTGEIVYTPPQTYDEIVECLPLPEIHTMEVDDCFLDRDFPRTGEPDKH